MFKETILKISNKFRAYKDNKNLGIFREIWPFFLTRNGLTDENPSTFAKLGH
jgi:hypothetical protein